MPPWHVVIRMSAVRRPRGVEVGTELAAVDVGLEQGSALTRRGVGNSSRNIRCVSGSICARRSALGWLAGWLAAPGPAVLDVQVDAEKEAKTPDKEAV